MRSYPPSSKGHTGMVRSERLSTGTQSWSPGHGRDIMLLHQWARAASPGTTTCSGTKPCWDTFWDTVSELWTATARLIRGWIQGWCFLCLENLLGKSASDEVWYEVPNASVNCLVPPSLIGFSDEQCNANWFTLEILPQELIIPWCKGQSQNVTDFSSRWWKEDMSPLPAWKGVSRTAAV